MFSALASTGASAHTGATARLQFGNAGTGMDIFWSQSYDDYGSIIQGDSPLDAASQQWFVIASQTEPYDTGIAFNGTTGIEGKSVSQVRNLSFDWAGDPLNVRGPRIEVNFSRNGGYGGYAFLSQAYCSRSIGTNGDDWYRSDFTGQRAVNGQDCGLWMHSFTGVWDFYTATSTRTAWQTLAAAKPGLVVKSAYWVFDTDESTGSPEGPPGSVQSTGNIASIQMDRLAIQNHMWSGPTTVRHCPTEASC